MLGYALTLGSAEAWGDLAFVLVARLTSQERRALALTALASVDPDEAEDVAREALTASGTPIAPLQSFMDEASFWADLASQTELKAYSAASFSGLNSKNKLAFLKYARGQIDG
jgi:hypothetical protein